MEGRFSVPMALGVALAGVGLGACALGPAGAPVEVEIPRLPPAWSGLGGLELVLSYRDAEGVLRRETVAAGERRGVSLPAGERRAVFVQPLYRGRALRPAGAVWPDDAAVSGTAWADPVLEPSWFGGWTASVVSRLEEEGWSGGFDLARLEGEARLRLDDPWLLDPAAVARSILGGSFRADVLDEPRRMGITLPGSGPWYPESPFMQPPERVGTGWLALLPVGTFRFYGPGLELFAAAFAEGESLILVRELPAPP